MPRPERPVDRSNDAIAGFADGLRRLREKAGSSPYRELARRAHYSASSLSEAASGRRLPSLAVTLAYVRACDGDVDEWETRWRQVATDTADRRDEADEETDATAPYVGLQSFGPQDAHRFHGRDRLLARLSKVVREQRLVIAVGASGAGKSSLLRAGLVAAARSGALAGDHPWPDVVITPGPHPLESCAVGLVAHLSVTSAELRAAITEQPRALALAGRQVLRDHDESTELLFVVDQFEEVFTLCRDQDERDRFVGQLVATAADPNCRVRIVLGVRADFYGHCARYPELVAALQEAQVLVGPMTSDELREAITQPAVEAGCRVETALVSRLIADAVGQPGQLPLLSHALLETWRRRHGNKLTLSAYDATGGIQHAIAHTAETAYLALSPEQQVKARRLFERLIALGEGTEDTKRRLPRAEFDHADPDVAIVLERLVAARLLVLDETGGEIAHEALIRSWPRLRDWLAQDREGLRTHRQLTEATNAWEALDRDEGALYRGARLAVADDWAALRADTLTPREQEFLDTSRALRDREQASERRRTRRLRRLVALLVVLLVVASATVLYAVRAERTATEQRNIALSQKLAGQAAALRDTNPALAAQLALAAYRLAPTVDARGSLVSTFATPYATQLLGHTNNVNAVAFHPNGKLAATAAWDNTVRLWDIADRHRPTTLATITAHTDNVLAVAFSPDGRTLATGSWDRTVRLWDLTDPRRPTELAALATGEVSAVAFSPDGRTLAAVGTDRIVRLWDVTGRHPGTPREVAGHTDDIMSVAFSPDGRSLVTSARDRTIRLWDLTGQAEPRTISLAPSHSDSVAFSPDGRTLAAVTNEPENAVRLWDVTDPRGPTELAPLTGHTEALRALAFSPDGRTIATTSADLTVRLWQVADPRRGYEMITLTGHTDSVVSVAFSPDGRTLATTSDDDTVRLWDLPGPLVASHPAAVCGVRLPADGRTLVTSGKDGSVLLTDITDPADVREVANLAGHTEGACGVALTPNGRTLVTGSSDGTVRRWDLADTQKPGAPVTIAQHEDDLDAVATTSDGRTLAVASDDATVRLIDLGTSRDLATLTGHTDDVHAIAFSANGHVLATTSWDHTVRLWDVREPRRPAELAVLTAHTQAVLAVAFSPDGRTMVTSSPDRTIRLWDVTDPRAPRESARLNGHTDTALAVAFSPDGHTLATGANDHTTRLWDVTDPTEPRELAVLTGHTDRVRTVAFGPDGHTLVTGSTDQTARLWETDPARIAPRVCAVAHPRITRRQWEQYLPGIDYGPPCG